MTTTNALLQWDELGQPISVRFADKYFSSGDGKEEALTVFCGGNRLAERWARWPEGDDRTFVIGETGFGTGLNFLCARLLWRRHAPGNARLHYVSFERFPLSTADMAKAAKLWPELDDLARELLECYAPGTQSVHSLDVSDRVRLTLIFDDVNDGWDALPDNVAHVDAWFLDGFAPSKNPDMWQRALFDKMARVSRPGTTFATFTCAGEVRRGLAGAGFTVEKMKGFGKKRHMLRGYLPS